MLAWPVNMFIELDQLVSWVEPQNISRENIFWDNVSANTTLLVYNVIAITYNVIAITNNVIAITYAISYGNILK